MNFKEIFDKYHNIAVYGMSSNPLKAAYSVPSFMQKQGYNIIPINPQADEINGLKVYKKLEDIPDKIEILNVFRPSDEALNVVKEAVERRKNQGDISLIWLQEGIINEEAHKLANENGIDFVQNLCMYKAYISI